MAKPRANERGRGGESGRGQSEATGEVANGARSIRATTERREAARAKER